MVDRLFPLMVPKPRVVCWPHLAGTQQYITMVHCNSRNLHCQVEVDVSFARKHEEHRCFQQSRCTQPSNSQGPTFGPEIDFFGPHMVMCQLKGIVTFTMLSNARHKGDTKSTEPAFYTKKGKDNALVHGSRYQRWANLGKVQIQLQIRADLQIQKKFKSKSTGI